MYSDCINYLLQILNIKISFIPQSTIITYTSCYHLLFINSIYIGIFSTLPAAWYQESLCDIIITGNCTISTLHYSTSSYIIENT